MAQLRTYILTCLRKFHSSCNNFFDFYQTSRLKIFHGWDQMKLKVRQTCVCMWAIAPQILKDYYCNFSCFLMARFPDALYQITFHQLSSWLRTRNIMSSYVTFSIESPKSFLTLSAGLTVEVLSLELLWWTILNKNWVGQYFFCHKASAIADISLFFDPRNFISQRLSS